MSRYAHLAFTDTVRRLQHDHGSARAYADHLQDPAPAPDPLGPRETDFITSRDGFYLATVSETGWPYLQYRGGPPGFVHIHGQQAFAFADVRGNRQYITTGNLVRDDRVAAFFMDYPTRTRMKILGRAAVRELGDSEQTGGADAALLEQLSAHRSPGRVERLVVVTVEGVNWNCRQHITPRYSEPELAETFEQLGALRRENSLLARENQALRDRLAAHEAAPP